MAFATAWREFDELFINCVQKYLCIFNVRLKEFKDNTLNFCWRFGLVGDIVGRINEVNQRRARLVLGWMTVCRRVNHLGI